eukprot:TRINITY_DN65940_c4_g1_i1.p1 TRINITY_DN65940_c4_g1~~TRINITY_DN65940_c4_g1_i1.p1  ORF type:complete len:274 (+),score=76.88 TRINITY_DN65940_c4_g1_i1:42-863(+)
MMSESSSSSRSSSPSRSRSSSVSRSVSRVMNPDLYSNQLLFFKRNNPILRARRRVDEAGAGTNSMDPTQVRLPSGVSWLGFPPAGRRDGLDGEDGLEELDDENIMVYSAPGSGEIRSRCLYAMRFVAVVIVPCPCHCCCYCCCCWLDQRNRSQVFAFLLYVMMAADFALLTFIFERGKGAIQGSVTADSNSYSAQLSYATTVLVMLLGCAGAALRDTRLLGVFLPLFYVDSVLNVLRVYTILQFTHFAVQIMICYVAKLLKKNLMGAWFAPIN